ncbi:MAG: glycosyltransferase family 4 protein [Actinomycetota bacterium]|nr:glycosyltransferase family 4 protein [Actinomycetota bacterium]
MRVLHLGNTANNGYLNAKLLRRAGIEADVLVDEWHILSQPEWEDAPLEGSFEPYASLFEPALRAGWRRPDWVISFRDWDPEFRHQPWLGERAHILASLPSLVRQHRRLGSLEAVKGNGFLGLMDVVRASVWVSRFEQSFGSLSELFARYDLVQAYSTDPILPLVTESSPPYIAFEHGTMREIPFEDTWLGRLLSLAYRRAASVVITNADVLRQAQRLGIENYVFIPHPVDETKYTPGHSPLRADLEANGADFVLLSPSRHDWDIKGSDRLLRAFAEFVRHDRPNAVLLLNEWGVEVDRSKTLIRELDVERNVRWLAPLPKLRLIDAYRAADVVLDQFLIGTFGAVAPEAMSCGRPVIMAFDAAHHAWCFPVLPPVIDARTPEEIHVALARLAGNTAERDRIGRAGRAWIEEHHNSRIVVERQLKIYENVLQTRPNPGGAGANLQGA